MNKMSRCKVFPFWIVFNEEPEELIFVEHKVSFNVKSTTFVFWEAAEAGNIRMGKHREWCVTFEIQGNLWDHCMGKILSFLYMKPTKYKEIFEIIVWEKAYRFCIWNLRNTRKSFRSLYGKKLIVSVYETYENERISRKNSFNTLQLTVVHGPMYGRVMGCSVNSLRKW